MHRAPLPTWVTKGGHMCLLGDAAHPFLPTSIQGCSQAIEDGCALATSLALAHSDPRIKNTVPAALRLYERLRYERVKTAQKKGEAVRDMWHNVDWSKVRENPELVKIPRETWLVFHDTERYVHRVWDRAVEEMMGTGPEIPHASLCAGPDSDEFDQPEEMPPSPAYSPKEEAEKRLA